MSNALTMAGRSLRLSARSPEALQLPVMLMVVFVWWLRGFARHQPTTPVTETIRGLLLRQPGGVPLGTALAWCAGILVVSVAVSAGLFRRRTA